MPVLLRSRVPLAAAAVLLLVAAAARAVQAQPPAEPAKVRWERLCQIRKDKFDRILPRAMRDHGVDMWITMQKENQFDPMYEDFGRGYVGSVGYYIFTDRGSDRIETEGRIWAATAASKADLDMAGFLQKHQETARPTLETQMT